MRAALFFSDTFMRVSMYYIRKGVDDDIPMGKAEAGVFNVCFCSNSMTVSTTKWTKTCLATISITKTQCTADCGKEGTGARLCQLTVF